MISIENTMETHTAFKDQTSDNCPDCVRDAVAAFLEAMTPEAKAALAGQLWAQSTASIMDVTNPQPMAMEGPGLIDHAFRSWDGEDRCCAIVGQLPEKIGCGRPASEHHNQDSGAQHVHQDRTQCPVRGCPWSVCAHLVSGDHDCDDPTEEATCYYGQDR